MLKALRRLFSNSKSKPAIAGTSGSKGAIELHDGAALLVMVKDGKVIHYSGNLGLPHVEFVKRTTGQLPEGAWVGTVRKDGREIVAISSKSFYGYQLPAPDWVIAVVRATFK